MSNDAISHYHRLLENSALAADSHERLFRMQEIRGLYFGDRPTCTVLRPRFLTHQQYRHLRDRVAILASAFRIIYQKALVDQQFRKQFRLYDWEEQLLAIDPGFEDPSPTSRFDAFYAQDDQLLFTEFNTETPAGAGYSDALSDIFYGLPVFQQFQRDYHVLPIPCKAGVLHALLDTFREWNGGSSELPRIAIMDWREVPTFSEFVLFYDYFRSLGLETRNVDPRDVEYVDGKLMCGDYHITMIYKRVLISELILRGGIDHPVVRAVRDRAVCMANTFRCKILFKKASFAVASDEVNRNLFTEEQREAIAAHIPWTRVVEERKTQLDHQTIDLIPFILKNRERFVLKPNDEYGGKGIVLGWTVNQAEWEASVTTAMAEPYVVQQRIHLPKELYPSVHNGSLHIMPRLQDTNPYVGFSSYVHGCLTRISTDELVNVTAGGGSTVPTFLVEKR